MKQGYYFDKQDTTRMIFRQTGYNMGAFEENAIQTGAKVQSKTGAVAF